MARRRRRVAGIVLVLVVAAVIIVVRPWPSDDDPRAGSTRLDAETVITIGEEPEKYRITYRIEEGDRVSAERVTVVRPFGSRIEIFGTTDIDDEPDVVETAELGRTSRVANGTRRVAVALPPAPGIVDLRLSSVIDDALDRGLLVEREQRRVLGRPCQVYRTGQTLRLVQLTPPSDAAHVDACIDGAGLVLEEVELRDREILRRRLANDVEIDPVLADDELDVGERTVPIDKGGGVVRELTSSSRPPGPFLELGDRLPLPVAGRYAVVPPQPDAFTDPLRRNQRIASVIDVLREGIDVVFIERGGSLGGVDVLPDVEHGVPVEVGALGAGELVLTTLGAEISVDLGAGRYVRVSGTLPADDLLAVARGLHEVDGGELTTIGEEW